MRTKNGTSMLQGECQRQGDGHEKGKERRAAVEEENKGGLRKSWPEEGRPNTRSTITKKEVGGAGWGKTPEFLSARVRK